ncbi:MAG: hypothetical protein JXR37_24290 [Kiritimatiellae bacterium]|nr:hypothetical protein [Kiritimatiellia bacterium]
MTNAHSQTEPRTPGLFPGWVLHLAAGSRIMAASAVVGVLLLLWISPARAGALAESLGMRPSKDAIFRAIALFRIVRNLHVAAALFVCSAVVCWVANAVGGKARRELRACLLAGTAYLVFRILLAPLPVAYLMLFFILYGVCSELNAFDWQRILGRAADRRPRLARWALGAAALVPFAPELLLPAAALGFVRNVRARIAASVAGPRWDRCAVHAGVWVGANLLACAAAFYAFARTMPEPSRTDDGEQLLTGNYYGIQIDEQANRLFACNVADKTVSVFDLANLRVTPTVVRIPTGELQEIAINTERGELYHADRRTKALLAFDVRTLRLKRQSRRVLNGSGSSRIGFDNGSGTIVVAWENDLMWLVDMDSLTPRRRLNIGRMSEDVVFDRFSGTYVISYFHEYHTMQVLSPGAPEIRKVPAAEWQGGLALSEKRKELYLALPMDRQILVYRLPELEPVRRIPVGFGARFLAYDEANAILAAASMCSGYIDIVDVQAGRRVDRKFIGYYLRQLCLNPPKREGFVSSMIGGVHRFTY